MRLPSVPGARAAGGGLLALMLGLKAPLGAVMRAEHRLGGGLGWAAEVARQRAHRRVLEELHHRHLTLEAGGEADLELGHQQRVPAELEEVVVSADLIDAKKLTPQRGYRAFEVVVRDDEGGGQLRPPEVRLGQRSPVGLSVGRQREGRQRDEGRRHHVFRQPFPQVAGQLRRAWRCVAGQVRHEAHVARGVLAGDHDRLAHPLMLGEDAFDLAKLDAETAQLHLVVQAAQVVDGPVVAPPGQVAGLVQAGALLRLAEGIGDELLRGQPGPVDIPSGEVPAADVQFAGDAVRDGLKLAVQHVRLRVGDGEPDRDRPRVTVAPAYW